MDGIKHIRFEPVDQAEFDAWVQSNPSLKKCNETNGFPGAQIYCWRDEEDLKSKSNICAKEIKIDGEPPRFLIKKLMDDPPPQDPIAFED